MTTKQAKALVRQMFEHAPVRVIGMSLQDWLNHLNALPAKDLCQVTSALLRLYEDWAIKETRKCTNRAQSAKRPCVSRKRARSSSE